MAIPITVPRLGWNMEKGVFVGWLKPDGAAVRAGETIFTLESEKATEDIECLDDGTLRIPPNGPKAGDEVPVGRSDRLCANGRGKAPFEQEENTSTKSVREPVASPSVRRRKRGSKGLTFRKSPARGHAAASPTRMRGEQHQLAPAPAVGMLLSPLAGAAGASEC